MDLLYMKSRNWKSKASIKKNELSLKRHTTPKFLFPNC
jgi:hypothetical protein